MHPLQEVTHNQPDQKETIKTPKTSIQTIKGQVGIRL